MPLDENNKNLINVFSKPAGQSDGPQLYEFKFGNRDQLEAYERLVKSVARELGIRIETRSENAALALAVESAEAYERLNMQVIARMPEALKHLIDHETLDKAYVAQWAEELEKDPNAFKFPEQTCQCDGYEYSR